MTDEAELARGAWVELSAKLDVALAYQSGRIDLVAREAERLTYTSQRHGERLGAIEQEVAVNRSRVEILEGYHRRGPQWVSVAVAVAGVVIALAAILTS